MQEIKSDKQARAEKLFANTPISKAIWIVAIPSLLGALMVGLYSFIDQVFIQQFVPRNTFILNDGSNKGIIYSYLDPSLPRLDFSQIKALIDKYNNGLQTLVPITTNMAVSTTTSSFQPLIIFSNSIVFLVPVGASIYYTKSISKKFEKVGKDLWATMFWCTVALSLIATLFSFILVISGFLKLTAGKTNINDNGNLSAYELSTLQSYYDATNKISLDWAAKYIYIYASGTILQGLVLYLSYLIRAEGYNMIVMVAGIIANIINICLDAIFIIPMKMGVLGGVVSTIIGWIVNLLILVIFIMLKEKQQKTWMSIRSLFHFKFNKKLLLPTGLLGFSGFIRSFGVAISFMVMNILLVKTQFASPQHYQFYWSKGMPIMSLFLISIFGINDGARSLLSYNYTRRDFLRCKQVYFWTILVAIVYSSLSFIFIASTARSMWVYILNVNDELLDGTALFIRIVILRLIAVSLSISSLLAFQGTNNVEKSILACMMENFICFWAVIPVGYGIAYGVWKNTGDINIANWIIVASFIINSLLASLILLSYSWWYTVKKIPKIDQSKLSWSRKIEHKFFEEAEKYETNKQ